MFKVILFVNGKLKTVYIQAETKEQANEQAEKMVNDPLDVLDVYEV